MCKLRIRSFLLACVRKYLLHLFLFSIFCFVTYQLLGPNILPNIKNFIAGDVVDFSCANNVSGFSYPIVPNIVHFIHFDMPDINFIQVITIKAVYINHKPEKILIHCNCHELKGKHWDMVKNISTIEIIHMQKPLTIFDKTLSSVQHASDIARIRVLMKYGGIYLDSDSYVIKSLDYYRKFEMSLGWPPNQNLGAQVLIAHKNARFLKFWYNSYRYYRPERWYYNAGELPTKFILERMPHLVHRVPYDFGVHMLTFLLYGTRSEEWKNYHSIHLLVRHKWYLIPGDTVQEFDEDNIKGYNKTFGDMARLVLYGKEDLIL